MPNRFTRRRVLCKLGSTRGCTCGLYDRRVLENTSLNLSNEVVLVIALTLCQFGICDGIPLLSPRL